MASNITFHEGLYIPPLKRFSLYFFIGIVSSDERVQLLQQKGVTIWLTGLSASGKVLI